MSEMDLLKRIEALENKVADLESTLETLKNIGKSERMAEYIDKKKHANSMIELIQHISGESISDTSESNQMILQMELERKQLEQSIAKEFDALDISVDNLHINENNFTYDEVDGGVEITGYRGFNYDSVIIPLYIKRQPVIGIGANAFNYSKCKKVYITNNVTYIGQRAFSNYYSLTEVSIGNGVASINAYAFSYSQQLKRIRIGTNVKIIGSFCFDHSGLQRISIPGNVEMIGTCCFANCEMLSKVNLNKGLKSIGQSAFENTKIQSIMLPDTIHSLGLWVFKNQFIGSEIRIGFLGNNKNDYICVKVFAEKTTNRIIVFSESNNAVNNYAQRFGFEIRPLSEFY